MRSILIFLVSAMPALAETFQADVWADNWFAMSINGTQVAEDSVPITTERSFNAETFWFEATRPFVVGVIAKDFKENDSGLEYIGTRRQQMGDGGFIAQLRSSTDTIVTDGNWRCLVVHEAPLNKACAQERNPVAGQGTCAFRETAIPDGWDTLGFDDTSWAKATEWRARDVRPKDGYDRISWDRSAEFIWGPDLETVNTVLCRLRVD